MAVERQNPREIFEVRFEYSRVVNAFVNGAEFRNIVKMCCRGLWKINSMQLLSRLNDFILKKNFLFDSIIVSSRISFDFSI